MFCIPLSERYTGCDIFKTVNNYFAALLEQIALASAQAQQ
jgi:hypothetical protein